MKGDGKKAKLRLKLQALRAEATFDRKRADDLARWRSGVERRMVEAARHDRPNRITRDQAMQLLGLGSFQWSVLVETVGFQQDLANEMNRIMFGPPVFDRIEPSGLADMVDGVTTFTVHSDRPATTGSRPKLDTIMIDEGGTVTPVVTPPAPAVTVGRPALKMEWREDDTQ